MFSKALATECVRSTPENTEILKTHADDIHAQMIHTHTHTQVWVASYCFRSLLSRWQSEIGHALARDPRCDFAMLLSYGHHIIDGGNGNRSGSERGDKTADAVQAASEQSLPLTHTQTPAQQKTWVGRWLVSLRSSPTVARPAVDCSKVAELFGGGVSE